MEERHFCPWCLLDCLGFRCVRGFAGVGWGAPRGVVVLQGKVGLLLLLPCKDVDCGAWEGGLGSVVQSAAFTSCPLLSSCPARPSVVCLGEVLPACLGEREAVEAPGLCSPAGLPARPRLPQFTHTFCAGEAAGPPLWSLPGLLLAFVSCAPPPLQRTLNLESPGPEPVASRSSHWLTSLRCGFHLVSFALWVSAFVQTNRILFNFFNF